MTDITLTPIEEATPPQLDSLTRLLSETFGEHNEQAAIFERWRTNPDVWALLACVGPRCVAVMVTVARDVASFDTSGFDLSLRDLEPTARIALFSVAATDPAWRRQGLSSRMATRHLARARDRGITLGAGISWEHGDAGNSSHMFEAAGFVALARSESFYREMHARTGQTCPRCGPEPCACVATLYVTRALGTR